MATPTNSSAKLHPSYGPAGSINAGFTFTAGRQAVLQINYYTDSTTPLSSVTIGGSAATKISEASGPAGEYETETWAVLGAGMAGGTANIVLSGTGDYDINAAVTEWAAGTFSGVLSGSAASNNTTGTSATVTAGAAHTGLATAFAGINSTSYPGGGLSFSGPTGYTQTYVENDNVTNAAGCAGWLEYGSAGTASASWTQTSAAVHSHIVVLERPPEVDPVVVDSVTPDTFADAETGIVIAGEEFGASQGSGRVVISPVDDIAGEPSEVPATVVATVITSTTNPTTTFPITVPASGLQAGDLLEVTFISRDHTSGTGQPTVSDNQSGTPGWTQAGFSANRQCHVFWRRYTSGVESSTITVAGCVGSSAGGLRVIRGVLGSGDPYADFVWEENASGNETHAGYTPTHNNSLVNFMVANDTNDTLTVTNMAAATLGTFEPEDYTDLSTGGNDCALYVSGRGQSGTATGTGDFTWSQTNATTISGTWSIRPKVPAGAAVEQTVTSWGDTSITFTADQDTLPDSTNLYLFVENDDGASNAAGEVVQFEAGSGGGFQAAWARGSNQVLQ